MLCQRALALIGNAHTHETILITSHGTMSRKASCRTTWEKEMGSQPSSMRSTTTWPLRGPKMPGATSTTPEKSGRIANRANALRTVASIRPEVLCSSEHACQRLALRRRIELMAETLHVERAVEMITRVRVPLPIAARHHDKEFALPGPPDPQRQPEFGAVAECHCVPVFTWNRSELH